MEWSEPTLWIGIGLIIVIIVFIALIIRTLLVKKE
jgi:hypothetical protein